VWVADLVNVTQAHIHIGAATVAGPIVAWLYPAAPPARVIPGTTTGLLMTGSLTSGSLVGPHANHTLAELVTEMAAGNAYTNVHTVLFPAGEIRGQIRLI
jgi:hypothetical protein